MKRLRQKTNPALVETLIGLKKTNPALAKLLARPVKKMAKVNLDKISEVGKDVLIMGKVLSSGELKKPARIVAWSASKRAVEKIKSGKGEFITIVSEVKKNPKLEGLEVLK